jgi:hypothetical protein
MIDPEPHQLEAAPQTDFNYNTWPEIRPPKARIQENPLAFFCNKIPIIIKIVNRLQRYFLMYTALFKRLFSRGKCVKMGEWGFKRRQNKQR